MNAAQQFYAAWMATPTPEPVVRHIRIYGKDVPMPLAAASIQPDGYPRVTQNKLGDPYWIWRGAPRLVH